MRRYHLFEIEDQPWCPRVLRDCATDFLQHMLTVANNYAPAVPRLRELLSRTGHTQIVDLCSGGGGPWARLVQDLVPHGGELQVVLTDRYPNLEAFADMARRTGGSVRFHPEPVDAVHVPASLSGIRTLFSSFHHFPPEAARAVLEDAVRAGQPIAIFEATHRSVGSVIAILFSPLFVLLVTPAIRPFRLGRLFWTYLVPLIPLLVLFDGIVSSLRIYTPAELLALAAHLDQSTYYWEAGEDRGVGPLPVTYLIGYPARVFASPDSLPPPS